MAALISFICVLRNFSVLSFPMRKNVGIDCTLYWAKTGDCAPASSLTLIQGSASVCVFQKCSSGSMDT